jgi:pimeloyl-ACP methyl ester carboxylesterase
MSEMRIDVNDHFVKVHNGEMFVKSWSPGNAAAIPAVLLHDSLGSVDLWRSFPERLAEALGRRVIAYDRLGFGRSTALDILPSARFIDEEAHIYFPAIREALGFEDFLLFGHSVGGAMALTIAARFGTRCRAVITESAQAFVETRTLEGIKNAVRSFADPGRMEKLRRLHAEKAKWVLQAWTEVWLSEEFRDWSLGTVLPHVRCPVPILHGGEDEFGSAAFPEMICSAVAGYCEMHLLDGVGHVPHRDDPELVLNLTVRFVEQYAT